MYPFKNYQPQIYKTQAKSYNISPKINKDTLLGNLQSFEQRLKKNQGQDKAMIMFRTSVQKDKAMLVRIPRISGESKKDEYIMIDEGLELTMKIKPKGKKPFSYW